MTSSVDDKHGADRRFAARRGLLRLGKRQAHKIFVGLVRLSFTMVAKRDRRNPVDYTRSLLQSFYARTCSYR